MKKEKRRYTSAKAQADKQNLGYTSTYLKLPDGAQMFKPKAGVMLIDILPFVAGKGNPEAEEGCLHWERTYESHRGIGANGDTHVCPRVTLKEPCPVCEFRARKMREGDDTNEDLIRDLSPKKRQLFNVINLKDPDRGVQIWDMSYHLFGKILFARLRNSDEDDGWDNFFHLEGGLTLKIGFVEKSFGGFTYLEVETIDFKPRKQDYDDEILEQVYCLDDLLVVTPYDELKKAFLEAKDSPKGKGKASDDDEEDEVDEEEEEETTPPPRGKKPAKPADDEEEEEEEEEDEKPSKPAKKPSKPTPEEDDEEEEEDDGEEEDDEEEEEEDEKPSKKPAGKKPAKGEDAEEDEDWDDFDDDDDEDEKPSKKPGKKK